MEFEAKVTELKSLPVYFHRSILLPIGCWLATAAWFLTVSWLSSKSAGFFHVPKGLEVPHLDKLVHFVIFGVGAALLGNALIYTFRTHRIWLFTVTFLVVSAFGIVDEYRQMSTPGRSGGDVGDWIADTLGALFALFLLYCYHVIRNRRKIENSVAS